MNTETIRQLTASLDALRAELLSVKRTISQLEAAANLQGPAVVSICGANFVVASIGRNYQYQVHESVNVIRLEAIRLKKLEAATLASRIEGVTWKIRQAAKEQE